MPFLLMSNDASTTDRYAWKDIFSITVPTELLRTKILASDWLLTMPGKGARRWHPPFGGVEVDQ